MTIEAADGRIDRHGLAHIPLAVTAEHLVSPGPHACTAWRTSPMQWSARRPEQGPEGRRKPSAYFPMCQNSVPARPLVASTRLGTGAVHQM